jgi:hypothetical protein
MGSMPDAAARKPGHRLPDVWGGLVLSFPWVVFAILSAAFASQMGRATAVGVRWLIAVTVSLFAMKNEVVSIGLFMLALIVINIVFSLLFVVLVRSRRSTMGRVRSYLIALAVCAAMFVLRPWSEDVLALAPAPVWIAQAALVVGAPAALITAVLERRLIRARRMRIALFRRFSVAVAKSTAVRIAPALAAYGRIRLLLDDVLTEVEGLQPPLTLDYLSQLDVDHILFRPRAIPRIKAADIPRIKAADWQAAARDIISRVDVLVFDVTEVSANVVWELERSLAVRGPEALLFIRHARCADVNWGDLGLPPALKETLAANPTFSSPLRYGGIAVMFRLALARWMLRRRRAARR